MPLPIWPPAVRHQLAYGLGERDAAHPPPQFNAVTTDRAGEAVPESLITQGQARPAVVVERTADRPLTTTAYGLDQAEPSCHLEDGNGPRGLDGERSLPTTSPVTSPDRIILGDPGAPGAATTRDGVAWQKGRGVAWAVARVDDVCDLELSMLRESQRGVSPTSHKPAHRLNASPVCRGTTG